MSKSKKILISQELFAKLVKYHLLSEFIDQNELDSIQLSIQKELADKLEALKKHEDYTKNNNR